MTHLIKTFEENTVGNDFVVGDIHGCYITFMDNLDAIGFDSSKDRLFAVGDLIDRGPNSKECLELVYEDWFHSIRGNHEDMMFKGLSGDSHQRLDWLENGGLWYFNLGSFEQADIKTLANDAEKLMPLLMEISVGGKKIGIAHANICKGWNYLKKNINKEDIQEHILWSRYRYQNKTTFSEKNKIVNDIDFVYTGHTPQSEIDRKGNLINIDTGAVFKGGKLTIVNLTKKHAQ